VSFTAQSIQGSTSQLAITHIEKDFINEISDHCKPDSGQSFQPGVCQTYAYFFMELAKYIEGMFVSTGMYGTSSDISEGNAINTSLAQGRQWREMASAMSVYGQERGIAPDIRNTTFAEDIENFALNASLSSMSEPSLWYVICTSY
jgi:hypothetical protein